MDVLVQAVTTARGQALADEFGIKFFETVGFQSLAFITWCTSASILPVLGVLRLLLSV